MMKLSSIMALVDYSFDQGVGRSLAESLEGPVTKIEGYEKGSLPDLVFVATVATGGRVKFLSAV